ncbi:MAG TPA: tetratricopeptide repeat protein, partial [Pirellulales bacterium]|nr:tetratricopeptide repeat protein [Pirellulales bacterium]
MTRCLRLPLLLLFCCVRTASAADDWLGETVIVKETARPQVGNKRYEWNEAPIPAIVQKVNGDWLWVGTVWVKQDEVLRLDDAPAYFTGLIDKGTNNVVGYALRGVSWLVKHEFENAIKDLTEAIRLEPANTSFYTLRGKAYYAKRNFDQALADFNE